MLVLNSSSGQLNDNDEFIRAAVTRKMDGFNLSNEIHTTDKILCAVNDDPAS